MPDRRGDRDPSALARRTGARAVTVLAAFALTGLLAGCGGSAIHANVVPPSQAAATRPTEDPSPTAASTPSASGASGKQLRSSQLARLRALTGEAGRAARHEARLRDAKPFVVTSLNVLGNSHTQGKHKRHGFGPGTSRIVALGDLMRTKDVSVAGLQEFQPPQDATFQRLFGSEYAVYPGLTLGSESSDNSIAWRTSDWTLVRASTVGIPYFGGRIRQMPRVLLERKATGTRVWFVNVHNPANIGGNQTRWRVAAVGIEAQLMKSLDAHGTPVVFTGDMNDREAFGCPFTAQSGMHSADGTSTIAGRCTNTRPRNVDWILGSDQVQFSDFVTDFSTEHRKLTDHPMVTAAVALTPPS